jgi:hypothetical protein
VINVSKFMAYPLILVSSLARNGPKQIVKCDK